MHFSSMIGGGVNSTNEIQRRSKTSSSGLLGLVFGMTIVTMLCVGSTQGFIAGSRPLSKRSFFDIQCKGVYDKTIFGRLDRICDDCYNLYREPQLHSLCRSNCFGSPYFKGCLDALLLNDDEAKYEEMIEILGKKK